VHARVYAVNVARNQDALKARLQGPIAFPITADHFAGLRQDEERDEQTNALTHDAQFL